MRRIILAGPPGAGKTTLLVELGRSGFPTISDSAREVIAERLALGNSPRPDPKTFALELLSRDDAKYNEAEQAADLLFFDRSVLESLAMVQDVAPMPEAELRKRVSTYRFYSTVFILPPWEAIYQTDAERDHSFAHAERVYSRLLQWYRWCGYAINEVPRTEVTQRAKHILRTLAASDA